MHSLAMQLMALDRKLDMLGPAILIADADVTKVRGLLQELKVARVEDAGLALSKMPAMHLRWEKFDWAVPDHLLGREFAAKTCDFVGAHEAVCHSTVVSGLELQEGSREKPGKVSTRTSDSGDGSLVELGYWALLKKQVPSNQAPLSNRACDFPAHG